MAPRSTVIQGSFVGGVAARAAAAPRAGARTTAQPIRRTGMQRPSAVPSPAVVQATPTGTAMRLPQSPRLSNHGGQPLPAPVLQKMEALFGMSFADVRIHVGPEVANLGARAITQESHIYFAPGQYNPASAQGQQLLGYELTHVVQQRAGRVRNPFGSGVAIVRDASLDAEAQRMAARALNAKPAMTAQQRLAGRGSAIQRAAEKNPDPVPGSMEWRDEKAVVGDRHAIPHPFLGLSSWYKTLRTGRIADLYKTEAGFVGHADAVKNELARLKNTVDAKEINDAGTLEAVATYEKEIVKHIIEGARGAGFDFLKYVFNLSGNKTVSVERAGGKLFINGKQDSH